MKQALSDSQLATFVALQDKHREIGAWPSLHMVAGEMGCTGQNVANQIRQLVRKGWVDKVAHGVYRFPREVA